MDKKEKNMKKIERNMKKGNILFIIGLTILLVAFLFKGCADVTPIEACVIDEPYGFLGGLWHGIIAPFSFVGSLFSDSIALYAVNNTGGWYDFGFILGSGMLSARTYWNNKKYS